MTPARFAVTLAAASAALTLGVRAAPRQDWQDVVRNLRHPDARLRLEAVNKLGNAGYTAAAADVAPLINDADPRVRFAAIDAELTFFLVEPIGERHILSFTGASRSRAQEAFDAGPLVRVAAAAPPLVVDSLLAALRDENARIRFDALHAVGVIAEPPLSAAQATALAGGLDHFDPVMRAATARVLGRLRVTGAGSALISALNDSNPLVRRYATEALGLLKDEQAVTSLLARFDYYKNGDMAAETLRALARIGHPSARDQFRSRLTDANPAIRAAAVEGIGRLADRDSLGQVHSMVDRDPASVVRVAAAFAVCRLGEPRVALLAQALGSRDTAAPARDYLLELGGAATAGVQSVLGTASDARLRADLLHVLGFIGGVEAVPAIEPYLKDRDERVSRAATNAITRIRR